MGRTATSGEEAKLERETVIRWDDYRDVVNLFTASPVVDRKLRRAGYAPSRVSTFRGREVGWFYKIPYRDLRWTARVRKPLDGPKPGVPPPGSDEALRQMDRARSAKAVRRQGSVNG